MPNRQYKTNDDTPAILAEPAVTYRAGRRGWNSGMVYNPPLPGSLTIDELKVEVRQSVEDACKGMGITFERAKMQHPRL